MRAFLAAQRALHAGPRVATRLRTAVTRSGALNLGVAVVFHVSTPACTRSARDDGAWRRSCRHARIDYAPRACCMHGDPRCNVASFCDNGGARAVNDRAHELHRWASGRQRRPLPLGRRRSKPQRRRSQDLRWRSGRMRSSADRDRNDSERRRCSSEGQRRGFDGHRIDEQLAGRPRARRPRRG